jgi:hypothetical protein
MDDAENLFGEPISTYNDRQALEDGVLVEVPGDGGVNRVTRAVFDEYVKPIGDPRHNVLNITMLMDAIRAMLKIEPDDGWRVGVHEGKTLWLIPNEVGGLTLMFPDDY